MQERFKKRALSIIFSIVIINLIGFGIIIPLLPFYAERLGASEVEIGFLFASFSIAQLLASPFLGALADRFGRRPMLVMSLLGTTAGFVLLAVANSLWLLFLSRIIDGLSGGNVTIARAYVADVLEEHERAKGYGMLGAAFGIGFIAGPLLGGLLVPLDLSAPAWAAAALAFIAMVATAGWLPETVQRHREMRQATVWQQLKELGRFPGMRAFLVADFLMWAAVSVYQTTFALFVFRRFGLSADQVSYAIAFLGVVGVLTQGGLVRVVVPRLGEHRSLWIGLLLMGTGLAVATVMPSPLLFLAVLVPSSIGSGMATPAMLSLLSAQVPTEYQGRLQGVTGSVESLSRIVGPIWGNGLLRFSLYASYLSAAAVIILLGLWVAYFLPSKVSSTVR